MTLVRIRPADGGLVRDPATLAPLPAEGVEVTLTPHWRRALDRGDVVRCEPPLPPREESDTRPTPSGGGGSTSSRRGK